MNLLFKIRKNSIHFSIQLGRCIIFFQHQALTILLLNIGNPMYSVCYTTICFFIFINWKYLQHCTFKPWVDDVHEYIIYWTVEEVEGHVLKLWKVSRMDMGAYMCIARKKKLFLNSLIYLTTKITKISMMIYKKKTTSS